MGAYSGALMSVLSELVTATADPRTTGVLGEAVRFEQFAQFQLNQFQQFFVVHLVDLVQEDHQSRYVYLLRPTKRVHEFVA
jgi:hypothetical protein